MIVVVHMVLRTVHSRSLADQVFEQLGREILTGRLQAGSQVPPERTLVETFGVNRHVVREALKRIEQLGLIRVTQGGGTVVLDYRRTAGLDLLAIMAEHPQTDRDGMIQWLAVHEMRAAIGADAARLCALRATPERRAKLVALAERMSEVADGPGLFELELEFWDGVIDGSGNIAYRLGFNTLAKAVLAPAAVDLARSWSIHEVKQTGYRLPIARAIAAGDAKKAEARTRESMNLVVDFLRRQLEVPPVASEPQPAPTAPPKKAKSQRR